ncbi:MAG: hypothetical protein ACOH1V_05990 [Stenotrophomonas sp.]
MIAGTIKVLGQEIRSRDCMQVAGATTEKELASACEGLANAFTGMGSEAGEVTYMDGCPSPSQGSCKSLFGGKFDAYYYERPADDLRTLPQSCSAGGGTWKAG